MKIAIFETAHFEGAYPVIRLFDDGQNDIMICTNEQCYRQFLFLFGDDINRFSWVIQTEDESIPQFIDRVVRTVRDRSFEFLYLNTIDNNHLFYARALARIPTVRKLLTLHDINTHFHPRPSLSIRRLVRIFGKMELLKQINEFNVVAMPMQSFLISKLNDNRPVHCVPGAVFDAADFKSPPPLESGINIVVPGSIDIKRRNYDQVFELLKLANESALPLNITLLGGSIGTYGKEIITRCEQYAANHANLKFYKVPVVDQPKFDRVMNDAHFVFIPSVINTVISD
ncbi:MAG: hypothetical protein H7Y31_05950, partial [Chitinophagaceae bacterium]|nr:hypothetical protein [Chitinophagaceae bacterium]